MRSIQKAKSFTDLILQDRQLIKQMNVCLVEGYTDVISLHQAGIENAVASGGTSLTTDQLRLIKKYSNNLTIIYDGDFGRSESGPLRGLDMALERRIECEACSYSR